MADVLTNPLVKELQSRLAERLRVLQAGLREGETASAEERISQYAGDVYDRGEESSVDAQAEINAAVLNSHANEIQRIRNALQRIEEGIYGNCRDCGEPIGAARLDANPFADRCINCQTVRERSPF